VGGRKAEIVAAALMPRAALSLRSRGRLGTRGVHQRATEPRGGEGEPSFGSSRGGGAGEGQGGGGAHPGGGGERRSRLRPRGAGEGEGAGGDDAEAGAGAPEASEGRREGEDGQAGTGTGTDTGAGTGAGAGAGAGVGEAGEGPGEGAGYVRMGSRPRMAPEAAAAPEPRAWRPCAHPLLGATLARRPPPTHRSTRSVAL